MVLARAAVDLDARARPPGTNKREVVLALFVPGVQAGTPRTIGAVHVVTQPEVV